MQEFISDFRETIETATKQLERITEQGSCVPLEEGKWSAKQVIGHLIDSAANNHARFVRAQLQDDLVFQGYEQNEWVEIQHYNDEPWEQLVALWRNYNLHLAHVISVANDEKRDRARKQHTLEEIAFRKVGVDEAATLDFLMRDYVVHLRHHLSQIFGGGRLKVLGTGC